ncbi:MAG: hypothetical protein IT443_12435 [Phycisphaeraceae bacterium]|nr:hypothetical protein [Phycisphaeraceae bacterium]
MPQSFEQLHRDVVFGKSNGKIIWQPRIGCWIGDRRFRGQPLPAPYTGLDDPQIFRLLGCCSARIYGYNRCLVPVEPPEVVKTKKPLNDTDYELIIDTPVGRQTTVLRTVTETWYEKHLKREVTTEEELRVAAWRARHTTWKWDQEAFNSVRARWGDLGAPTVYTPRVGIQELYVEAMGVEAAIFALYDWPDAVADYCAAREESFDRLIDLLNNSPIDIINFGDNVHAGTLTPDLFEQYVLPVYQSRCQKLHAAGKFVHAHWDGDTKPLLPYARRTGLDGIEAITPVPQGDVTLEEIKAGLGDDVFLIDGIPAVLFDETYPVSMLEDYTHKLIELFAPKLVLGISDEISSTGDIERIRTVGRIVDEYNARC